MAQLGSNETRERPLAIRLDPVHPFCDCRPDSKLHGTEFDGAGDVIHASRTIDSSGKLVLGVRTLSRGYQFQAQSWHASEDDYVFTLNALAGLVGYKLVKIRQDTAAS